MIGKVTKNKTKTGDEYTVRLPKSLVEALALESGDIIRADIEPIFRASVKA